MTGQPAADRRPAATPGSGTDEVLAATRDLLWLATPAQARDVAVGLVEALGGEVVPATRADGDAVPVDLSFGEGEPLLPWSRGDAAVHALLLRHMPRFVRDAHRAVELTARTARLAEEAEIDPLTGLASRRMVGRALGRLHADDVIIMLDLDRFKELNDTLGHVEGDRVLRALGRAITETVRARDLAGRYGGEEFVVVQPESDEAEGAEAFLGRLRTVWERSRPHPVTFSAGIARAGADPSQALKAADEAMYEAKRAGRDRWVWAGRPDDAAPAGQAPGR